MFDFARPDLKVYALPPLALLVLAMAWIRALPGWGRRVLVWTDGRIEEPMSSARRPRECAPSERWSRALTTHAPLTHQDFVG